MQRTSFKLFGLVVSFALVSLMMLAIVTALPSAAQTKAATTQQAQIPASPTAGATTDKSQQQADHQAEMKKYGDLYLQKLAASLGVTTDKLTGSIKDAALAVVDQQLADGKLTQAQADAIKVQINEQATNGTFDYGVPFGGRHGGEMHGPGHGGPGFGIGSPAVMAAIATKLGLTIDELHDQLRGGKTLLALATEKNVSEADLRATIVAALKTELDAAVKAGKLTQAQADTILQQAQTADLNNFGMGGRRGGHGFGGPPPVVPGTTGSDSNFYAVPAGGMSW